MEQSTVTLPSYWACALINGDASGLEDDEAARCDAAAAALAADGWEIVDTVEDSERFTWSYDLYDPDAGVRGGDVMDYVVLKS